MLNDFRRFLALTPFEAEVPHRLQTKQTIPVIVLRNVDALHNHHVVALHNKLGDQKKVQPLGSATASTSVGISVVIHFLFVFCFDPGCFSLCLVTNVEFTALR